ncbi:MAG: hypothetical protein INQ03_21725 [Candidatus Heimdallarchaeota archaeon]|nr:hypothetical protein [Candidatus Heimdallarchaeota archaeon]
MELFSWIAFYYREIRIATVDKNRYAVTDNSNNILVWEKTGDTAELICITISPITINQLHWVRGTKDLAIISEKNIYIWDIEQNKKKDSITIPSPVRCINYIEENYLIYYENNELHHGKKVITNVDLIWFMEDELLYHKDGETRFLNDLPVEIDKRESNALKTLQRRNKLDIEPIVHIYGQFRRIPNLSIPVGMHKYLDNCKVLVIFVFEEYIIYQAPDLVIVTTKEKRNYGIFKQGSFGYLDIQDEFFVLRSVFNELLINETLMCKPVRDLVIETDFNIHNAPGYIYLERPYLRYTRLESSNGYMMLATRDGNHYLYDTFEDKQNLLTNTGYKKNTHVFIDKHREYLLEWQAGSTPPRGVLTKRDMYNNLEIIYEFSKVKPISKEQLMDPDFNHPRLNLVIPAWRSVEMNIKYGGKTQATVEISLSSLYYYIHQWSSSELAALLQYEKFPEKENILVYGDLILDDMQYYGIAPLWSADDNFIVTCSFDMNCYIWKRGENIPMASFLSGVPVLLEIVDGRYVACVNLYTNNYSFQSRDRDEVNANYPMARISVFDISKDTLHQVEIPINTHIKDENMEIMVENGIWFFIPNYIDNDEPMVYHFTDKLSRKNPSEYSRYWMTHTSHTKLWEEKPGDEFPIDPHPEIRRELHFRPFAIFERELVRKTDDLAVIAAHNIISYPQISNHPLYDHRETVEFLLPYPRNRKIMTNIRLSDSMKDRVHLEMKSAKNLPRYFKHKISRDQRMKVLVQRIIDEQSVHNLHGISYRSGTFKEDRLKPYLR